jgi:hypothetical protein
VSTEAAAGTTLGVDVDVGVGVDVDVGVDVGVGVPLDGPLTSTAVRGLTELELQPTIKTASIKKAHVRMNVGEVRTLTTFIVLIFSRQGRVSTTLQANSETATHRNTSTSG